MLLHWTPSPRICSTKYMVFTSDAFSVLKFYEALLHFLHYAVKQRGKTQDEFINSLIKLVLYCNTAISIKHQHTYLPQEHGMQYTVKSSLQQESIESNTKEFPHTALSADSELCPHESVEINQSNNNNKKHIAVKRYLIRIMTNFAYELKL